MEGVSRAGGDRLSRALRRSTIGPGGLNDRVRNGFGWEPPGKATNSPNPRHGTGAITEACPYGGWVCMKTSCVAYASYDASGDKNGKVEAVTRSTLSK